VWIRGGIVAAGILGVSSLAAGPGAGAQDLEGGRRVFEQRCARCHGASGGGGEMGPSIRLRLSALDDAALAGLVRDGRPLKGMPGNALSTADMPALLRFLRTLERAGPPVVRTTVQVTDGRRLEGQLLGEGFADLQLLTDDKRIHLLRRAGDRFREVTSETDWPTYNGGPDGNRHTTLTQIDKTTVGRLSVQWLFTVPEAALLQATPIVVGGILYVTTVNQCYALDAGSGRPIWHYKQPTTRGVAGGYANRGAAVAGDRLFMETDHAHIIALDRLTGELLWDATLADWRDNYAASSAPLPAGNLVISGVSGGEHGANGFVAAHDQATGKEVWRFWTVPRRGEPGAETWQGKDVEHGGAPTWFTGSYDPVLDIVYWPTGNPSKEYDGDDRKGDNLYANSVVALDRKTGRRLWHYQFTPHDVWDWDATQTSVLVDREWQGTTRNLMLHADRNGFFYVFDRRDGTLLLAKPFVENLTWASGIGADGRPIKLPDQEPTASGTRVCPSQDGATNWYAPSFNPATGLYYVQTFEKCSLYVKSEQGAWEKGREYLGGTQSTLPDPKPARILRAIDIRSGAIAWELPQPGPATSWGGTLSTATGLVFVAEEGGSLLAVDAESGQPLWSFATNQTWRASPMTYMFDGRQYVAIAAGPNVVALAVPDPRGAARGQPGLPTR
jgi:alcohol dehydrogenase (cytochrome c)